MRFEYGWQRVRPLAASLFLFAVACGGPSVQNPGPGSPASVRAEGAPAPEIATSITRDPLAEDPMPSDEEHDHAHHGRSSSPPAPGSPQPHQHGSRDSQGGSTEDHSNHGAGR